ncbi:2-hydroxyacid dehydrogenase [Bradyrhizobium sp. 2TAF24]|uniref:2-hydroxyacid dehydrogenase n=1 Tax=Bradyrhizobium sp. 2TAF24 TaxID=3233011 RepID=UPI003F8E89C7
MASQVLIYSRFPKKQMLRIGERFDLLDAAGKPPHEVLGADQLAGVRALITAGGQPLGAEVMASLPRLGAIVCYGTGYDGIDLAAAAARGIVVGNSPAANAGAVADLALTLMLAATRRVVAADQYVRSGGWVTSKPSPMLSAPRELAGARVGVYGMGEIGRRVAARAAAFETEVAYHSRSRHDVPYPYFDCLADLVAWCDILIVAVRAGADTQHIIDADMLKKLGPEGTLVNIARGSVVDQQALVAALRDGAIGAAGLDVYEAEPHAPDALTELPNVVLTPHIGGHTAQSHLRMQDCVIANLGAFFAGEPLPYPVRG